MKKIFLLAILGLSCGCATPNTVRPVNFNQEEIFEASCHGRSQTQAVCYELASKHCNDLGKKAVPMTIDGSSYVDGNNFTGDVTSYIKRTLIFRCESINGK